MELTIEQALQKAVEAHKAGKLQDAESLYRAILQAQPNHPDANHNLGVLAVSLNKTEAALPLFKIALEANPNQGQFWLSYIDALIKEKQFDNARNVLEQGKKQGLAGEKVDALNAILMSFAVAQDFESEKAGKLTLTLDQIYSNRIDNPTQIEMDSLLENYHAGRFGQVLKLAINFTEKYSKHPFGWKVLGAVLKITGKLHESLIANQKALEISPTDAEAHNNLGNTLKELGSLEDAETSYKTAIAINPKFADAYSNLGNTLKELGKLEAAEMSYRTAIAIKPDFAVGHYNLGNILKELGNLENAEKSYKTAISINPKFADAHNNLGNTLKELGKLEAAETSYKTAISINPKFADAHSNLGNVLKDLGKLEAAEMSYRSAIAIKPDFVQAHSNLGNTLKELGKLEAAEMSYRTAIAIKPDFAEGYYNLGVWLFNLGKYKQAKEILISINFKDSQSYLLRCLYIQNEKEQFFELLDSLISQGTINPIIGSLCCRAEIKYGIKKSNTFCSNPFQYVLNTDLGLEYDFLESFLNPVTTILNSNKRRDRLQASLTNGNQTAGNIFSTEHELTYKIKKIIYSEIEKYQAHFKESDEGFIKNWPSEYNLYGWLISMKSGGKLRPHIHERGWISGSIYINVPSKSNSNSGNLVVCIDDDEYLEQGKTSHEQIIDVTTGSMCLFPASLLHYTIPFESDEERIVLAFDVVPKIEKQS
jgi:tetratricopeptide (TPR) repeat protein